MNMQNRSGKDKIGGRDVGPRLPHDVFPPMVDHLDIELERGDGQKEYARQEELQPAMPNVVLAKLDEKNAHSQNGDDKYQGTHDQVEHERRVVAKESVRHDGSLYQMEPSVPSQWKVQTQSGERRRGVTDERIQRPSEENHQAVLRQPR